MTTISAGLHAGLSPAKWRALNALFYAGTGGINLRTLRQAQQVGDDALVELEDTSRLGAYLGREQVRLGDLGTWTPSLVSAVRVRLTSTGNSVVVRNPANQVIAVLGGQSNGTARVRDLKAEGMADDDLLRRMDSAGLIEAIAGITPLDELRHIPDELPVRLTSKGRQYFPYA